MVVNDTFNRPLRSVRVSVTDRCNLRCQYCMPEEDYIWLPHDEILTFEELGRLADILIGLGVEKFHITGGEPLLRRDVPILVRTLAQRAGVRDLALTTNGVLLARFAAELRRAGLARVTVSLDTLRPERFRTLTRSGALDAVLEGIHAAGAEGMRIKLNAVIVRGLNDDELLNLLDFGARHQAEVRFIEYMDVGGATHWRSDDVVPRAEMLDRIERRFGRVAPLGENGSAPAERFALPDGSSFGIIASTTAPFCGTCDRGRLTADGMWFLCLYAAHGLNLKRLLRGGATDAETAAAIATSWKARDDRGAERRLAVLERGPLVPLRVLRSNVHAEMHTRGG